MTDPTEELVMAGEALLPAYPRGDAAIMVETAVKAEREACAKIAEDAAPPMGTRGPHAEGQRMTSVQVAAAIRARSKE